MPTIITGTVRKGANVRITSGCSKRLSSKAAASEETRRTLRYVEFLSEARTPLADFFSILRGGVMPRVTFLHSDGRSGDVEENISLLEAAKEVGFRLNHDCGGNASCTTCRVEVQMGHEHLSEIDFDEQDLLDREALTQPWHRLACQARVLGDVVVRVPEAKWENPKRATTEAWG